MPMELTDPRLPIGTLGHFYFDMLGPFLLPAAVDKSLCCKSTLKRYYGSGISKYLVNRQPILAQNNNPSPWSHCKCNMLPTH